MRHIWTYFFIYLSIASWGQNRILIDDDFSDWDVVSTAILDQIGDKGNSGIDFGRVKFNNDETHLFIYFEIGKEINLQDLNSITLFLDTDNNPNTGLKKGSLGAELTYTFGNRRGTFYKNNSSQTVFHQNIGLVSASTVSNDKFEIALDRNAVINGEPLFKEDQINLLISDESFNGDRVPNDDFLKYIFSYDQLPRLPAYQIQKPTGSDFRVLSYNVLRDNLFESFLSDEYERILQTIQPDIIGFQEIYDHDSEEVANKVSDLIGGNWFHAQQGPDNHAISKYPIIDSYFIPGYNSASGNGGFLIDLPDTDRDLLFIVAHTPCCDNDSGRQAEVDAIMGFIRDAKDGSGPLTLKPESPIIIVGDMNLVGKSQQLETFLNGNIINTSTYGPRFDPDWDGKDFIDGKPYTTDLPFAYTWYDEGSSFSPGRLDFTIYSGSVLDDINSYALFTPALSTDTLNTYGLQFDDVLKASDHLPIVTDFKLKEISGQHHFSADLSFEMFPNPGHQFITIQLEAIHSNLKHVNIINSSGRKSVSIPRESGEFNGHNQLSIDISNLANGIYWVQLETEKQVYTRKLIVHK